MLGKRSDRRGLWEADPLYLEGRDTFCGLLASLRGQLFPDADFAELNFPDNGRASVVPSLLATALGCHFCSCPAIPLFISLMLKLRVSTVEGRWPH